MIRMIVPMLITQLLLMMPEQSEQDDDRQRDTEQPKQCASSQTHVFLHR
jgi:hypothetical protein